MPEEPENRFDQLVQIRNAGAAAPGAPIARRDFLKATGAAAAGGALAGCRTTGHILPLVVPDGRFIPGIPQHYATVCRECPAGCGMHIRVNDGRPTKPEGNPRHPLNRGKLCMRGQSSVQGLYNPDRFPQPMRRDGHGRLVVTTWPEALARLRAEMATVAAEGREGDVVWLGRLETGTLDQFLRDWLAAFHYPPPTYYEAFAYEAVREANRISFGRDVVPFYRFDRAKAVVTFGAEFLQTWVSNVQFATDWAMGHSYGHTHNPAYFIHVGPRVTMTGANADEHWQLKPGTEALVAMALAERVAFHAGQTLKLPAGVPPGLGMSQEEAAKRTEIPADVVDTAAKRLSENRPSLLLPVGYGNLTAVALTANLILNAINAMLGNTGSTILLDHPQALSGAARAREVADIFTRAQQGGVRMMLLHHANPAFNFPGAFNVEWGLSKIPFIVSFGWWRDETTKYAQLVLPDSYPLESWGDYAPIPGLTGMIQPARRPVFNTRPMPDVLLWLAAQAGPAVQGPVLQRIGMAPAAALPPDVAPEGSNWQQSPVLPNPTPVTYDPPTEVHTFDAYLRRAWQQRLAPGAPAAEQAAAWRNLLMTGVHITTEAEPAIATEPLPGRLGPPINETLPTTTLEGPNGDPPPLPLEAAFEGSGDFYVVSFPTVQFFDGRQANRSWMQEIADPLSKLVWDSWVQIHPDTGWRLHAAEGSILRLETPYGHGEWPVHLDPFIRKDTLAIPLGQGHRDFGMFATNVGEAPQKLWTTRLDAAGGPIYMGVKAKVTNTGKTRPMANLQLEHWQRDKRIAEACLVSEASTAAVRNDEPRATFYAFHPTPVHRWGMAVDLSSCIGCNACQTACYAENNIAVMGRSSCLSYREMTWLRIETYAGDAWHPPTTMNPDIRFLPMPCQQCGNAPCEYVCPVFAAYHTDEGLNAQIYNRCIGTRYCSNNCIYKVRRFNWYTPMWPKPLDQQLNPAVIVRAKGVMEKCTFCVQRIEQAELKAKAEKRPLRDGEIQTACMQTCPTEAIVFGDLKDPNSRVSQLHGQDRGYRLFWEENTFPAVTYLKRTKFVLNGLAGKPDPEPPV